MGGVYGGGTVFELTRAHAAGSWTEKVIHHFGYSTDGSAPFSSLIFDAVGNLFGTTFYGGTYGVRTAFGLTPTAGGGWTEQVLHSFGDSADGSKPNAALVIDAGHSLYGTTIFGGTYDVNNGVRVERPVATNRMQLRGLPVLSMYSPRWVNVLSKSR